MRGCGPADRALGRKVVFAAGLALIAVGGSVLGLAAARQQHAPQPGSAQAGSISPPVSGPAVVWGSAGIRTCAVPHCGAIPATRKYALLPGSLPVSISIPAIGVDSRLLYVGLNPDGTIQVPPLDDPPLTNQAAWYKYSSTPGQPGPAIIEGHVDSASGGPSVFFRLGALKPGDLVEITLADHRVAVFDVTGVRLYSKARFPTRLVYGTTAYAALRLITCGGAFDEQTRHYESSVVAFAALVPQNERGR